MVNEELLKEWEEFAIEIHKELYSLDESMPYIFWYGDMSDCEITLDGEFTYKQLNKVNNVVKKITKKVKELKKKYKDSIVISA